MPDKLKIAVILASTRPERVGPAVADWVMEGTADREAATYTLVDLADQNLPLLDEPEPASSGTYPHEHTRAWSELVTGFDGFVFVTPEYNRGIPGALKNSLDFLYAEWNDKAAAFVGYGVVGAARAVEHLRGIASEVQLAHVRQGLYSDSWGVWALAGICLIVIIETGLLFPFLPGDSLLFTVGLFIGTGALGVPLWLSPRAAPTVLRR